MLFVDKVYQRWPNYEEGRRSRFKDGISRDELRRLALETQLDCKIMARYHVANLGYPLPKLLYYGPIDDLDFSMLPSRYVIKPRCQTGIVLLIEDGVDIKSRRSWSWDEIREFFNSQWSYRELNNSVIVEEWVCNSDGGICSEQAKCLIFHGKLRLIHYVTEGWNLASKHYDFLPNWERIRLYVSAEGVEHSISRPPFLDDIVAMAEALGSYYEDYTGIPHARLDIFPTDAGPVFGEFAGGTNGGVGFTDEGQNLLSSYW